MSVVRFKESAPSLVGEISRMTAESGVPAAERVDFHIGNPVRDAALDRLYNALLSGASFRDAHARDFSEEAFLQECDSPALREAFQLLFDTARKSVAYAPQGGFLPARPGTLARQIQARFEQIESPKIPYDFGTSSGKPELAFASGGRWQALALIFQFIEEDVQGEKRGTLVLGDSPRPHLFSPRIHAPERWEKSRPLQERLQAALRTDDRFVLLLEQWPERDRELLAHWLEANDLFLIEMNQSGNAASLLTFPEMKERGLRILAPDFIHPALRFSSLAILLAPFEWILHFNRLHFKKMGTPSASEIKLLSFFLTENGQFHTQRWQLFQQEVKNAVADSVEEDFPPEESAPALASVSRFVRRVEKQAHRLSQLGTQMAEKWGQKTARFSDISMENSRALGPWDPFGGKSQADVVQHFFARLNNPNLSTELTASFLSTFQAVHPEYEPEHLVLVSGSARTALSLMASAWNIEEVVVPDFSWTVGDAFPQVTSVPLKPDFQLDAERFVRVLQAKCETDPAWPRRGAVILNNPHNATGQIWPPEAVEPILLFCFRNGIRVIDDLSYADVVIASPEERRTKVPVPSLKKIALNLKKEGRIRGSHLRHLVTIQSISKTDCKAGARLAVCDIPHSADRRQFHQKMAHFSPNLLAILLSLLFYRRGAWHVARFWARRDEILWQRSRALTEAFAELPPERNPYGLRYLPPAGAMYPQLEITHLPTGLSAERLAQALARLGIGLIPLTNFSHTLEGFSQANRTFRLTLGGELDLATISAKVRRLVEMLSELVRRQAENRHFYRLRNGRVAEADFLALKKQTLTRVDVQAAEQLTAVREAARKNFRRYLPSWAQKSEQTDALLQEFVDRYLPERWSFFRTKLQDFALVQAEISQRVRQGGSEDILNDFQMELLPPEPRKRVFQYERRLFDRTVHPTQMYALDVEQLFVQQAKHLTLPNFYAQVPSEQILAALLREFVGGNVPISSEREAEEAVCDLESIQLMETVRTLLYARREETVLSMWGDWDGSTRPSGQGHTLISGPLIANIRALARLVAEFERQALLSPEQRKALAELGSIEKRIQDFRQTLQKITRLTGILEKKYRKTIPLEYSASRLKRGLRKMGLLRDPLKTLWKHNDRNERRMQQYRRKRSFEIKQLFSVNRSLTELVRAVAEQNPDRLKEGDWPVLLGLYKNYLKRFYLTPRIHQKIILDKDQFAVDTTVTNLVELNVLAAQSGLFGFVFTVQVSMASNPRAILALYRKLREERARALRENPSLNLPEIKVTPLFEELEAIQKIPDFLNEIWDYAKISRQLRQPPEDRFLEIIGEFFIAGSDLSQQVGQLKAYSLYQDARELLDRWLWQKNLLGKIRIKFGSGESPQRQGGYYRPSAGSPALDGTRLQKEAHALNLTPVQLRVFQQARSPLSGILSHSDFRTFQSNVMEHLRSRSAEELAHVFFHIGTKQQDFWKRILPTARALHEKNDANWARIRPTIRREDSPIFLEFLDVVRENFVQIVYGRPEDMTGIHVVSYFLSRTLFPLRDRPTVRPSREPALNRSREIVERLSSTLPLATHGTLLRAIGHNKAQTFLLGVNQFTTGVFRGLVQFLERHGAAGPGLVREHILPHLPVHDILDTLRLFHNTDLTYVRAIEDAFPSDNSALQALREENSVLSEFIPLFQQELLRRNGLDLHGVVPSRPELDRLLPFFRPDLAVLLQRNLFNTKVEQALPEAYLPVSQRAVFEKEFGKRTVICENRQKMWKMLREPISEQVKSFIELARAVQSLFTRETAPELPGSTVSRGRIERLASQINDMLRNVVDDSMRQFLLTAVQYLLYLPENMKDVPEEVLLALRDMEKILRIEEEALSRDDQKRLMALFLKMARVSGNCG